MSSNLVPLPTPVDKQLLDEKTLGDHRNLFCPHYSGCLDYSVHASWDDWTCANCPLNKNEGEVPRASEFAHWRREDPLGR